MPGTTCSTCCLACRYETLYTGGFKGIIKTTTLSKLRADTLSVVDLDRLDARRNLLRKEMPVRELTALIASASEPLAARHAVELEELDAREEQFGTRGSGRAGIDARHKRELRRLRTEELQFGLRVLARRYGRAVAEGGGAEMVAAVTRLREANDALVRNPNESLLLHNLFWNLPVLGG